MPIDPQIKVLVVEDFDVTRKMQIKALSTFGMTRVVEAADGLAAMNRLREDPEIGLVISDWNMPEKNGYELLEWVRADETHRDLPFIMATAQAERKEAEKAASAGASGFITKPFTADELKAVVERVLGGAPETAAAAPETSTGPVITQGGKVRLRVAHIQITDHLILGILDYFIRSDRLKPKYFELETRCMSGWNPVQQSIAAGDVDVAFVLAPIAMDIFSAGAPIRLTLFAHKNGSICVKRRKSHAGEDLTEFFRNRVFYIPHVLSVHHMLSDMFFRTLGLEAGLVGDEKKDLNFEVIPPINMPVLLGEADRAGGFMVAQPIGRKAIADGGAELLFLSGEMWENHPCCVVVVRESVIERYGDAIHEFTEMLVQAGGFIESYPEVSARIAVDFLDPGRELGLSNAVLDDVLRETNGIRTDDLFPVIEDLDTMQRYMTEKMGVGSIIDLERFVDRRFAEAVSGAGVGTRKPSAFRSPEDIVRRLTSRK